MTIRNGISYAKTKSMQICLFCILCILVWPVHKKISPLFLLHRLGAGLYSQELIYLICSDERNPKSLQPLLIAWLPQAQLIVIIPTSFQNGMYGTKFQNQKNPYSRMVRS